tara:strand:+ start:143 stop:622 length:480 start_codon:yes stop_codon:yes gene_type:complete
MNCPNCESKQTRVTVTSHREGYTIRYCRCLDCKHKFKTEERIVKYEDLKRRNTRLDEDKVRNIRLIAKKAKQKGEKVGETNKNLAIEYDVDLSTIKSVIANRTWTDVEQEPETLSSGYHYMIKRPSYAAIPEKKPDLDSICKDLGVDGFIDYEENCVLK